MLGIIGRLPAGLKLLYSGPEIPRDLPVSCDVLANGRASEASSEQGPGPRSSVNQPNSPQSQSSDRLVGQVLADRYQILSVLGEGGMGRVYLAEHVRMGRKSAVKVMSPNMALSADAISRFNREAANASRINHPNVAQIYDFGETTDGMLYLAMEFVEGETLRSDRKS